MFAATGGGTGQLDALYAFAGSPLGLGVLLLIAITLYVKKRWLSLFCAAITFSAACYLFVGWLWFKDPLIEERLSLPILTVIVLAILSLWLAQYGRARVTQRFNTIDLDDDLSSVEILENIEQIFEIKIKDPEAEKTTTMGELEKLVREKLRPDTGVDPIWALLCEIARAHSRTRDPIDRETTFFVSNANERGETSAPSTALNSSH
jgi:acyl carrier protein